MFVEEFNDSGYIKMKDLLTEYNMAHINTSEATDEIRGQYYLDKIDILKHVVSIPKISITYNIHEALTISDYKLNTPGIQCYYKCNVCTKYTKNKPNELKIGGLFTVFIRYAMSQISRIKSWDFEDPKFV